MFWQFLTFYLANILTFYPAHVLTHFLALVLTYILTFFLARSLTLHLAYILTFHLTFYLANILTYFLTFYLACILAHILLFYLAHILTCYLRLVLPTAIRSWWLKSGAAHRHPELAKGRREGLRERRGGTVLIKSDGPHLAGGEQKPAVRWSPVLASGGAGRVSVPCNWSTQLGWVGLGGAGWGWSTRCRHVVYKGWGGVGWGTLRFLVQGALIQGGSDRVRQHPLLVPLPASASSPRANHQPWQPLKRASETSLGNRAREQPRTLLTAGFRRWWKEVGTCTMCKGCEP